MNFVNITYPFYGIPYTYGETAILFQWPAASFVFPWGFQSPNPRLAVEETILPVQRVYGSGQPCSESQVKPELPTKSYSRSTEKKVISVPVGPKAMRNAISNVGNLLLTYISTNGRSLCAIKRMFPELTELQLEEYYTFSKKVKNSFHGYTTFRKLAALWRAPFTTEKEALFTKIIRALSLYYIREILPLSLLTSKQIRKTLQPLYLSLRRRMLALAIRENER